MFLSKTKLRNYSLERIVMVILLPQFLQVFSTAVAEPPSWFLTNIHWNNCGDDGMGVVYACVHHILIILRLGSMGGQLDQVRRGLQCLLYHGNWVDLLL